MGVGNTMLSIGGLNLPAVCGVCVGGGGPLHGSLALVARVYCSNITGVSRGLIGGYTGQGGNGGREFIPILTQNLGLQCGRNRLWGEGRGGGLTPKM